MNKIMESLQENRQKYHEILMEDISEYLYRDTRYEIRFAMVAIFLEENSIRPYCDFKDIIRETDKVILLEENFCCIILDVIPDNSCVKAAENIQLALINKHYKNKFLFSVVDSKCYENDYFKMINTLLDTVNYTIKNKTYSQVIDKEFLK